MARKPGRPRKQNPAVDNYFKNKDRAEQFKNAVTGKTDRELIEEAIKAGKVTKCPDGTAEGSLQWKAGTTPGSGKSK